MSSFLICMLLLGAALRLAVAYRLLPALALQQPPLVLQAVVQVCILLALYAILKLRHGGEVWRVLGWTVPPGRYLLTASLGGAMLAIVVTLVAHFMSIPMPAISVWNLAVLAATLGPILEESFFRGCLLPLVARSTGLPAAVILTALLFAFLHQPPTLLHCVCFAVTGLAYGCVRVVSGSTAAAAVIHAAYNITLFACQRF